MRLSACSCTVGSRGRISNRHVEPQHPRGVSPTDDCGILDRGSRGAPRSLCTLSPPARCLRARGSQVGCCGVHRDAREGPRDIVCPGGRWIISRGAGSGAFPNRRWVTSPNVIAIIFPPIVDLSQLFADLLVRFCVLLPVLFTLSIHVS